MKTKLKNRTLWFDGVTSIPPEDIIQYLINGGDITKICVEELTPEIEQYNSIANDGEKLNIKTSNTELDISWNIPEKYRVLDIEKHIFSLLNKELEKNNWKNGKIITEDGEKRIIRVKEELLLFQKHNLNDLLKAIIFLINSFKDNNIIWGIGRGSSVSSYILYLVEVHDIDSVLYDLDINEFIH